jgi:hypothetical protein
MTRFCAVAAPLLMLLYGVLRWFDGLDGHRDKTGALWRTGHVAFFAAILLLAVLAIGLARTVHSGSAARRAIAAVSVLAVLFGAACFEWTTVGDLFARLRESAPLPGPLETAGPALFEVGLLVLLILAVVARRVPFWSPILVLVGFGAIGVNLNLLPIGAVVVLVGLLPLARRQNSVSGFVSSGEGSGSSAGTSARTA